MRCLAWEIRISESAVKTLKKLDSPIAKRIHNELLQISLLDDPRSRGKALTGNWGSFWRYRVGSYRIICRIEDEQLLITAVKIGHRSNIYQ
ncbi:type II toxin-antitoxin system RelE family toxin [Actinotignum urinale]|uniref:type II toxin-antitoxin system RelE family toxin n=1 Tax=Actinotignum urinale TaxID=190146 RepID=UPI0027D34809|nr:type II toxin-antitoxin system RelE/ParE family toxin [Actinotignum urinale]MDY5129862.1 type II toxin-antitoxin system RelE/ParE family toxin [Actinotignum urinale]MDY5161133.1 type II toxin-antitoxin system RelE/ParE family toxin [Actinotignum urinale]